MNRTDTFCSLCGKPIEGEKYSAFPLRLGDKAYCCNNCRIKYVIPFRIKADQTKETQPIDDLANILNNCELSQLHSILYEDDLDENK